MDPSEEIRNRMRERELQGGRERTIRRDRASGGVKSAANDEAAKQFEEERKAWREKNAAKLGLPPDNGGNSSSGRVANVDEEDQQISKAHELQQENRDSLANSIRMAKEATEVGQETLMKLTAQKEQMKKMDDDLDKTNESLGRSGRVIRGMKSTMGGLKNWLTKPKEHQSEKLGNVKSQVAAEIESEERDKRQAEKTKSALFSKSKDKGPTIDPTLTPEEQEAARRKAIPLKDRDLSNESEKVRDALTEMKNNQDVEDHQLDELGELLGTLKGQAKDMNTELRQQTIYVDHLDDQLTKTGVRVKNADTQVKQIH